MKLVNPANKRKYTIIVVGTGLAGASAAASLGELGYNVLNFCIQDSPAARAQHRRAGRHQRREELPERRRQRLPALLRHGQGRRLPLARSQRLSARAAERQHHRPVRRAGRAVRARVRRPARQSLVRRRAGLAHVLRARPDRPAAAARRLSVADAAGARARRVQLFARREMLDLVVIDGKARGIIVRNLMTGEIERYAGDAVILATGGYGTVYYLSTNAVNSNVTAAWRAHKRGALFANPCYTQIHPTCIPVSGDHQSKLTLMSESLRNDGRVWVPKKKGDTAAAGSDSRRRARLLPRAEVSELRQPRAARRRVAQRQAGVRRRPRRRRERPRRLPRFQGRDRAARPRRHQGEVRQPLPDVPEDHRREPVQGADAHLPGHPLHDGRALGRLQPDEHHARACTCSAKRTSPITARTGSAPAR